MAKGLTALAVFAIIWPASIGLTIASTRLFGPLPLALQTFVTTATLVPLLVFFVMPSLQRVLNRRA